MPHSLHNMKRPASNRRSKKRVGRGSGSGKGTYATRGLKGQRARAGGRARLKRRSAFQQFLMRTPKLRGFKRQSPAVAIINLGELNEKFKDNDLVTPAVLVKRGLIRKTPGGVKILGDGKLEKKLTVKAHGFSRSAQKAITNVGGSWEIIQRNQRTKELKNKEKVF